MSSSTSKHTNAQNNNNSHETDTPNSETNPSFFSGWKIGLILFVYWVSMNIYKSFSYSGKEGIENIFKNTTTFDVNLYVTGIEGKSGIQNGQLIYTIPNRTYKYFMSETRNESIDNIDLNFTYDLTQILTKKNNTYASIYLTAEIKFKNRKDYNLLKKFKVPISFFYPSINVLSYVDNLSSKLQEADMMNDMELSSMKDSTAKNTSNHIPNLYYKPFITLYTIPMNSKEDPSFIPEFSQLKIPYYADYVNKAFFPIIRMSDFWTMGSELVPLNKTHQFNFTIHFSYSFIRRYFFATMTGIIAQNELMEKHFFIPGMKDLLVELFKYNSVAYLVILFTVNILHSLFSFLGFSNDISYYAKLKKLDGVYTKYIFFNIFHLFVTFLYILIKGSNFLVKIELFISLVIELWKMHTIFKISFDKSKFPFIQFEHKVKFQQEETKTYESEAIWMMVKFLLIPVAVLYLVYHFYYYTTHSIINFIIEYIFFLLSTFGFILMTPQLFLNYKLQSVENLPLKAMAYKFLNTIIDDLYAFAVKSPTMYRIFCFKDDVVFVVYLYQIFKYKNNSQEVVINAQKEKELETKKNN